MNKYKVKLASPWYRTDEDWKVVTWVYEDGDEEGVVVYTGSLADCEAWIRLKEGGYLD